MRKYPRKKDDVKETMQIHSLAKVEFYKSYLVRYLEILNLVDYIHRINIYDVFCGMGIYSDGNKGSAIVAFDIIKDLYEKSRKKKVCLILNDSDIERVNKVKGYINMHNSPIACCDVNYNNIDANNMLDKIKTTVKNTPSNVRNLVFIDPYGYKEIKKEMIDTLMKNGRTEVMLFLPISHMYRFSQCAVEEKNRAQYRPLYEFIKSFFPEDHPIVRREKISVREYINYIREALCFNDRYYSTSYHIERRRNHYFALFFISANLLGFEKILEVKWELDEASGNGFNLPRCSSIQLEIDMFKDYNPYKEKLGMLLLDYLSESRTNCELYKYILKNEFLPRHAMPILKDLQNKGQIAVRPYSMDKKNKNGAFYLSYKDYKTLPRIIIERKI